MNKLENKFDIGNFTRVEDIIFLDEPILTHLRKNERSYFLYLVDETESTNIYLFFQVEEEKIYSYLTGEQSLRNFILSEQEIFYLLEQDGDKNVVDIQVVQKENISEEYLPLEDSFLNYSPAENSYYFEGIRRYRETLYLQKLKEKAFYLKFENKSNKYAETIGFIELVNALLKNVSSSYKSFLKIDFYKEFKQVFTDSSKLDSIFKRTSAETDLRAVDLNFGSFEIGLAVDELMKSSIEDKNVRLWAIAVAAKYKDLVLNNKFTDEEANSIIAKYSPEERKKIFEPIFKITENPNYALKVKDTKESDYSEVAVKDKSLIPKILPQPTFQSLSGEKEYEIIQLTTVQEKNSRKKLINLDNTLFDSLEETKVTLTNKNFEEKGYHLDFDVSLPLEISTSKGQLLLSTMYNGLIFESTDPNGKIEHALRKITEKIYEYILKNK